MSWQVKSIKCQEGPSPEWPQMGYGWSCHLNASNQKDLFQVLELLDQSFENEEIYIYVAKYIFITATKLSFSEKL